jgi:hypothetical protein
LVNRQDRVTVWASQLANGEFPPVCAMTGAPSETWRKFRFSTSPPWAFAFAVLICVGIGFFVIPPLMYLVYLVGRNASGSLPLTHESVRKLGRPMRFGIPTIVVGLLLLVIAALTVSRTTPCSAY